MPITLVLDESNDEIKRKILKALREDVAARFNSAAPRINKKAQILFSTYLTNSDTWKNLLGGQLQGELGFPDTASFLPVLRDIWVNSIQTKVSPITIAGNSLKGELVVSMIQANFQDVLSLSQSTMYNERDNKPLPWLEWLLTKGTERVITDAYFANKPTEYRYSRTGLGYMIRSRRGVWSVPPEFAGTLEDNWITRVLDEMYGSLEFVIQQEIEK